MTTNTDTAAIVTRNTGKKVVRQRYDVMRLLPKPLVAAVIALLLIAIGGPIVYMIFASISSDISVARGGFWPDGLHFENYVNIWSTVELGRGLVNSILVSGLVAVVCAFVSVGTAYVLVRYAFRGRLTFLRGLIGLQSIPGTLMLLPLFVLFSGLSTTLGVQIIGTHAALIITYFTFALPFSTWVMVTYLRGLPIELEEAARIDGASPFTILVRVIVPLSWPAIIVSGIFAFIHGWNDVLFASVLSSPESQTAAVVLQVFGATQDGGAIPMYGQLMAAALICAAPVVILYLIFQRYLVGGMTAGAVK